MSVRGAQEKSLREAHGTALRMLLDAREDAGYWVGRLSSSALATATTVSALCTISRERFDGLIEGGVRWLLADRNSDGGWGDSPESPSNLPTTLLADVALRMAGCEDRAEDYLAARAGPEVADRIEVLRGLYGADHSFVVPILMNLALADAGVEWRDVPRLPFELACLPRSLFRAVRMQVVSYALPALIAVGQVIHDRRPPRNPLLRLVRNAARTPTLRLLERIQPESGGYLEAVPLTAFVAMSLAALGRADSPVVSRAIEFLQHTVREDGSWPMDSNLSVWLTTMTVEALAPTGRYEGPGGEEIRQWLLDVRQSERHPYTGAAPGGWPWTHLPGGVPDADDTSGALVALARLGEDAGSAPVRDGLRWLGGLQNADGGWPTFCRGWGKLPFDRSTADITAHALRAFAAWGGEGAVRLRPVRKGLEYLTDAQRPDGAWAPLWFGSQTTPDGADLVYGTARVLPAWRDLGRSASDEAAAGVRFLLAAQGADGGWGGGPEAAPTVEDTALAIIALDGCPDPAAVAAVSRGAAWLVDQVKGGGLSRPAPIGLYFARLWYSEALYPVVWTTAALGRLLKGT